MKKIIFLVGLLASASVFSQTVGGTPGQSIDSSNNPSGQGFGGALGGGPAATQPTSPADTQTSPSVNRDLSVPRGTDLPQQRMEDQTNFTGGSLGGSDRSPGTAVPPATSYPSDTPVAPSVPNPNVNLPRTNGTASPLDTGTGTP